MAHQLKLEELALDEFRANPRNARTHTKHQISQIAGSIEAFGFTNPILVDETGEVIAGHGRLMAAQQLGFSSVPAIRVEYLSTTKKRALMLADNKIALNAGWDMDILANELAELTSEEVDLDIDLTGFEMGEIDVILETRALSEGEESETAPIPDPSRPGVSKYGDVWLLGPHRVMCGDAMLIKDVDRLMQGDLADVGFTDPPYNVPIKGHVSGKGQTQHREFVQASGEMDVDSFTRFLARALTNAASSSRQGAVWFACMDWRHIGEMMSAGRQSFQEMLNLCVWTKTNGGMGSLYRSQHELVFVFRNGETTHRNNVQLGRFGRNRTNVWSYPGVNTFREGRMDELAAHPTAKPIAMIRDALMDVSARGEIVMDPFLGGGATLMAAETIGRFARGMELDPLYVDVAIRRWRAATGKEPVRQVDGQLLRDIETAVCEEVHQ